MDGSGSGRGDWNDETSLEKSSIDDSAVIAADFMVTIDGSSCSVGAAVCLIVLLNSFGSVV